VVVKAAAKGTADQASSKGQKKSTTNATPAYAGTKTTFNFQDVPVRSALQLIADISGTNLVAADSVGGSVTLHLVNVPWDQALDVILRAKGLDKRKNGNVIWIAPQTEMAQYEHNLAAARSAAMDTEELVSDYVPISYGKAADIAKLLTSGSLGGKGRAGAEAGSDSTANGFLSPRGSVSFDQRTNTLLLNDTAEQVAKIRKLIAVLDKPVQQVLIESRIVVATDDFTRELGAKFGLQGQRTNPSGQLISIGGHDNGNGTAGGLNVSMPATSPSGSFGFAILGANYALDLELSAAQTEGRSEVISSPRVITANQQEAVIRQGQEIGYVTYQNSGGQGAGSGTATVQFKDAVLELKVTPTITADDRVYLAINVKKDALAGYVDAPGSGKIPTIDTREINTSVLVDNGQTVVLGGIYETNKNNSVSKVPGLGDIPGIGALFRKTSRSSTKAELLIFVTPRILSDTLK
jgi:type IV pilus assembly protein PilQ